MSRIAPDAETSAALQHLANRYWAQADGTEPLAIGDLFAADAVLVLGPLRLDGLSAIKSFFAEREASQRSSVRTTRHLASNFLAWRIDPVRFAVRSTVMVFAGTGVLPLTMDLPSGIADFEDVCYMTPDGRWLFETRVARTIFVGPGAASFAR